MAYNTPEKQRAYNQKYSSENREKIRAQRKAFRMNNKEKIRMQSQRNYIANRERILERGRVYIVVNADMIRAKKKLYYQKNRKRIVAREQHRRKSDIQYLLGCRLRIRINSFFRKLPKSGSAIRDLGCSVYELKYYLEGKFTEGMSWNNYGREGWHIDHEVPLSFFDLTDREQFLRACHYTNLQPMWAVDNLRKSNKISTATKS